MVKKNSSSKRKDNQYSGFINCSGPESGYNSSCSEAKRHKDTSGLLRKAAVWEGWKCLDQPGYGYGVSSVSWYMTPPKCFTGMFHPLLTRPL